MRALASGDDRRRSLRGCVGCAGLPPVRAAGELGYLHRVIIAGQLPSRHNFNAVIKRSRAVYTCRVSLTSEPGPMAWPPASLPGSLGAIRASYSSLGSCAHCLKEIRYPAPEPIICRHRPFTVDAEADGQNCRHWLLQAGLPCDRREGQLEARFSGALDGSWWVRGPGLLCRVLLTRTGPLMRLSRAVSAYSLHICPHIFGTPHGVGDS